MKQATNKKNTARLTAALFALILLFPCCMDSGSGGSSSDSSDTIVAPAEPAPDNSGNDDSTDDNGDDSGKTEPAEPNPDTPDDSKTTTEIDSNTDMSKLNPTKKYIFKATDGTVDAAKLVYAKKILGENLFFTETNVNYILDFSNKSFANTTDEIESRSEYASKKGLTSSTSIITDENLTETIKIGDVEFITKPIYYKNDNDKVIQQAFKFGKNVDNVTVSFGNIHSMTEAYKGGIILENSNATIEADNIASTTLTGNLYAETMGGLSENSLMKKLTNEIKNVNISGNMTSDKEATFVPTNVRFSGNVSGLNFTATTGKGIIDFAGVGPKSGITAVDSKVITRGLKGDGTEKYFSARVVDFYGVEETVLKDEVNINSGAIETVYSNKGSASEFKEVSSNIKTFKTGSSASTNQAWEKKGRGETVSGSDLISKLDVKAKADNPLLQKLLDENCPVYG